MKKLIIIAWFVFMATPATSAPHPGKKAFAYYSCNQCHSAGSLAISAAQITAKYQGQQGAYGYLLSEFKKGTFDKTGNRHLSLSKEMTDKQMENVMEWLVGNRDTSAFTASQDNSSAKVEKNTGSSTSKAETSSGAAVLGAIGAVAGVYLENQEAKSNSRSRNSRSSQPAAQARTQTSQNNYPSDNNYEQSSSNSSSSSSSGRETTLAINHCASVTRDKYETQIFKNVCNIPISLYWCVESECASDNGRLVRLKPGSTYNVMAGEGKQFYFIACPQPYLPNERPNGVFDGKSVTCEK